MYTKSAQVRIHSSLQLRNFRGVISEALSLLVEETRFYTCATVYTNVAITQLRTYAITQLRNYAITQL
jgi:hypothetical protein